MIRHLNIYSILSATAMAITIWHSAGGIATAQSNEIFALRLSSQPFTSSMCKKIRPDENIHIRIASHRNLVLRKVPNQFMPQRFEEARKKSYVHYLTLEDLTSGAIKDGAIAFNIKHAVIFSEKNPQGISRADFVDQLPRRHADTAIQALNTFLRLHKILNAAIDGCRPYPSHVTYGTDDEFDKIEAGRLKYRDLVTQYNAQPNALRIFDRVERGISEGYYDPRTQGKRVSYQAVNPLNFFRP